MNVITVLAILIIQQLCPMLERIIADREVRLGSFLGDIRVCDQVDPGDDNDQFE